MVATNHTRVVIISRYKQELPTNYFCNKNRYVIGNESLEVQLYILFTLTSPRNLDADDVARDFKTRLELYDSRWQKCHTRP